MDPRTAAELEQITRERLDDLGTTRPRWSSEEIRRALSEGEREACLRGDLLHDTVTEALVRRPVEAGRSTVLLHPSIYRVDGVRRESDGTDLRECDEKTMRMLDPQWRAQAGSSIEHYLVQALPSERLQLRLYPIPTVDEVLWLDVRRLPRDPLEGDDDEPEIAPRHHEHLVSWALYRCFSKRDPDTYDPVKASDHLAEFTAVFGERDTADVLRKKHERTRATVTPRDF